MEYLHDKEKATDLATKALERIKEEGLSPTPDAFTLWYVYYSGQSPEVVNAIEVLKSNGQQITDERCLELYERFLSDARSEAAVMKAGRSIQSTIDTVSGAVKDVKSATSEYSGKLDGYSGLVSGAQSPEAFQEILKTVMADTENMLEENHKLEMQLDRTSAVMAELQRDLENVRKEALTDSLTGLSNRKAFDSELMRIAEEAKVENYNFSLLMIDIDHFKNFNDNFGHQIGDQVLRLVAKTLIDGVKGRDVAARYGGEEFAIILPETPLNAAIIVGNALRLAVATKDVINRATGEKLTSITMSVGVAEWSKGEKLASLIERADSALYTAKHNGRNQVAAAPTPVSAKAKEAG